ncbi:hypothetical protein PIB30_006737 [Stylosanthes scabra]|uniref:Uncharacterized protein n=1 Tax=Stylosanthes scabra TaxID=79078 RepID=A0ABU6T441_9FABA|nr:hypothetical protein [Stylosanthes scabra]
MSSSSTSSQQQAHTLQNPLIIGTEGERSGDAGGNNAGDTKLRIDAIFKITATPGAKEEMTVLEDLLWRSSKIEGDAALVLGL